jgi:hypothetical protein
MKGAVVNKIVLKSSSANVGTAIPLHSLEVARIYITLNKRKFIGKGFYLMWHGKGLSLNQNVSVK